MILFLINVDEAAKIAIEKIIYINSDKNLINLRSCFKC